MEELINNLKAEIEALKEVNTGLKDKIKEIGKQPSTKPVSTTAKQPVTTGVGGDSYIRWRDTMRELIK